jgi:hypothetical protein
MWLTESKDYAAAEPLLREALELRKASLGEQHPDVAASMTALADLLIETRRFEQARELAAQARAIATATLSQTHWRTANAASAEGAALAGLHQYEAAERLLLESYGVLTNDSRALPVFIAGTRRRLASLYNDWGKLDRAAIYLASSGESERR